jgi:hypothetical protein
MTFPVAFMQMILNKMVKKNYTVCLEMGVVDKAKEKVSNFSEYVNNLIMADVGKR